VDGRPWGIELGRTTEEDGEALGRLALGEGRLGAAEGRLWDAEGRLGAAEGRLALEPREPWNDDDGREALAPREEEPEEPREGEAELPLDPRCASRTEEGSPPARSSARPMVMGSRYFMGVPQGLARTGSQRKHDAMPHPQHGPAPAHRNPERPLGGTVRVGQPPAPSGRTTSTEASLRAWIRA
jgi:hypothetical protein